MKKNQRSVGTVTAKIRRPSAGGGFVLGRHAFARVTAVERIVPSDRLQDDLDVLQDAAPDVRRAALTATPR